MSLKMCLTNNIITIRAAVNPFGTMVLLTLKFVTVEGLWQHSAHTSTSSSPASYMAAELRLSVQT